MKFINYDLEKALTFYMKAKRLLALSEKKIKNSVSKIKSSLRTFHSPQKF